MPKWGLAMKEGKVGEWLTEEGVEITTGEEVLEVETDKITSAVETPHNGILRRKVASSGEVLPVGSLLAVIAESSVPQQMIDHFIEDFQQNFVEEEILEEDQGPQPQSVEKTGRLVVVDESGPRCGMAADIASLVATQAFGDLKAPIQTVTPPHTPVPFSDYLEDLYIPNSERVIEAVKNIVTKN